MIVMISNDNEWNDNINNDSNGVMIIKKILMK